MADDRQSTSAAGGARGYKRSWKNLLINKRYQLRFTLFMVLVSTLLMVGLGWWVMKVADEATRVQGTRVRGNNCPSVPRLGSLDVEGAQSGPMPTGTVDNGAADAEDDEEDDDATPVVPADDAADKQPAAEPPAVAPPADKPAAPSDAGDKPAEKKPAATPVDQPAATADRAAPPPDEEPPACKTDADCGPNKECRVDDGTCHFKVQKIDSSMTIDPVPARYAEAVAAKYECELAQAARLEGLQDGRTRILLVLIGSGLLLVVGLAIYGIKMTHKVAGPLYKITLYMGKMRDGRYDKVYNLRKGDQLVEFYDHFKTAHAGVVDLEEADIAQLKAVLAAADAAGVAGKSPDLDAALAEARAILARKEKALE